MTHESVALEALARLFEDMDRNYGETARRHGFACHGCPDNCCHTRFYHHTLVEYLYLRRGLEQMTPAEQGFIRTTASQQVQHANACMNHDQPPRLMCPLNRSERCLLYAYRPMICRLHGIPHATRRPDGRYLEGPGCDDFYRQCGPGTHAPLDRSPHYTAMAQLERRLREQAGYRDKLKMTIAQMLLMDLKIF